MSDKPRVLFLCTANSCRSQMAQGWLRALAGDRIESLSAGTDPHGINPLAVQAMGQAGVDIAEQTSDPIRGYLEDAPDLIIAVCSNAAEACPTFPGSTSVLSWPFEDPASATGDEAQVRAVFERVRDEIRGRLEYWLAAGAPPLTLRP